MNVPAKVLEMAAVRSAEELREIVANFERSGAIAPTDMRKPFDGPAEFARSRLGSDPRLGRLVRLRRPPPRDDENTRLRAGRLPDLEPEGRAGAVRGSRRTAGRVRLAPRPDTGRAVPVDP
ncbi:MAG: hypothetical protein OXN84_06000 [Albidovulum sp.]|nr:hypothetical protein [Albidovulum sp.]